MESTVVNNGAGATSVNPGQAVGNMSTSVNSGEGRSSVQGDSINLETGFALPGEYVIQRRIGDANTSGEADVFLCTKEGKKYAAKIFRWQIRMKRDLEEKLSRIKSEHIAHIRHVGEVYGRRVEVYDFFEKGSLADTLKETTFSEDLLEEHIIPGLNEALHDLHSAGILHRDMKPSNIMWANDRAWAPVLIDFGLSYVIRESLSVVVSQVGFTATYAAPEVLRNVYFDESDYYSMGIILYELFTGKAPFGSDNDYTSIITRPGNMPIRLYNLILGLTYQDLSYRRDKSNPNRRWTYEEVKQWLSGKELPVPGAGSSYTDSSVASRSIPPISFCEKQFRDIDSLCYAMGLNWEYGKQLIFRDTLTRHLQNRKGATDNQLYWASLISDFINSSRYDQDQKMTKILYALSPDAPYVFSTIGAFDNIREYGLALFDRLNSTYNDIMSGASKSAETLLRTGTLSAFISKHPDQDIPVEKLKDLEARSIQPEWSNQSICYSFELAYLLSGKTELDPKLPDGATFRNVDELKAYLSGKGEGNFIPLYETCACLIDGAKQLKPSVYGWFKRQGYVLDGFNL